MKTDQELIDNLMRAADALTKASIEATVGGLNVSMVVSTHMGIPGPSSPSVQVGVCRVTTNYIYNPNQGVINQTKTSDS